MIKLHEVELGDKVKDMVSGLFSPRNGPVVHMSSGWTTYEFAYDHAMKQPKESKKQEIRKVENE